MPRAGTQSERVYAELRAEILTGRLLPGERLPFAELCTRYKTSVGVVREGLSRLSAQGLVRSEPQQGFRVTPLSVEDLLELTQARREVESLVLRYAVENGGLEWESRVVAAHHVFVRTPTVAEDGSEYLTDERAAAHSAFHLALMEGCPNARLRDIAAQLRDSAELYRRWSYPLGQHAGRDIDAEHTEILDAVLARDADRAATVMMSHIQRTTDLLLENSTEFERSAEPVDV